MSSDCVSMVERCSCFPLNSPLLVHLNCTKREKEEAVITMPYTLSTTHTVKWHFSMRDLFMWIMQVDICLHKFVSHYIILAWLFYHAHLTFAFALWHLHWHSHLWSAVFDTFELWLFSATSNPWCSLPTAKPTSLGDTMTVSTNAAVIQEVQAAQQPRKRKAYTSFATVIIHCF